MDNQPEEQHEVSLPPEIASEALEAPKNNMPTIAQLSVALGILVLIFGASYIPELAKKDQIPEPPPQEATVQEVPVIKDQFEDLSITAGAAYVWDVKNQRALYNKNAGAQLPLASVTKLMTTLVAYESLDPDAQVRIGADAIAQEGDSNLAEGQTFALKDLANLTLVTSSNDGAYALAAAAGQAVAPSADPASAFIDAMNAKAESLGLSQSFFANPTGLDIDGTTSGSYGSARDMAFLMEYLVLKRPDILEETREAISTVRNQQGAVYTATNTNEVVNKIPGILGSKTGFTDLAGGNLVIAYDAGLNRPIIISVLGSTREGRFSDMIKLIEATERTLSTE